MNRLIAQAIRSKRLLNLVKSQAARTVEPHAYGLDGHGRALLLCYDITNADRLSRGSGWQLLTLDDTVTVTASDEQFQSARLGYRRGDTGICSVFEQI